MMASVEYLKNRLSTVNGAIQREDRPSTYRDLTRARFRIKLALDRALDCTGEEVYRHD